MLHPGVRTNNSILGNYNFLQFIERHLQFERIIEFPIFFLSLD